MTTALLLVCLLWFVALLNYLDRQVIFSLLPLLRQDLGLSDTQLGLLATSFPWLYAAARMASGFAAARFTSSRNSSQQPTTLRLARSWESSSDHGAEAAGRRNSENFRGGFPLAIRT